jgi:hypothetical protein
VLWPLLHYPSEYYEVHKAGVHIDDREGNLGSIVKLVKLFSYILFNVISIIRTVFAGVKVEGVGAGIVSVLEDAHLLDTR